MARGFKCVLFTIIVFQTTLFLAYYALKDTIPLPLQWKIGNSSSVENAQANSTFGEFTSLNFLPSSLWDWVGWGEDTEERSSNKTSSRRHNWETRSNGVTVSSREIIQAQERMPTLRTSSISPRKSPDKQYFQQIDDKNEWIYSAFFDHVAAQQGRPMVRIFGIFQQALIQKLFCSFSFGNGSHVQADGRCNGLTQTSGNGHIAGSIQCNLVSGIRPTHVSISFLKNQTATNQLQIIYPGTLIRNFTVCYSVLHSGFDSSAQLIQSLEMNRILGAEHFMVYNYSISPDVDLILRRYQQDGLVTVIPWPVPTPSVHYYGQIAALNDCFYRTRNTSRFVVVVDTDEFIIPRKNLTWMELLDTISPEEYDVSAFVHPSDPSRKRLKTTGSFEFRSTFFTKSGTTNWTQLQFSDEEKENMLKFRFLALSEFWRSKTIFPKKRRSKYIARPEFVYVSGVHWVHSFVSKMSSIIVNDDQAIVHHYRYLDEKDIVLDTSILKFKDQLYPRLMQQCQRFPSIFR